MFSRFQNSPSVEEQLKNLQSDLQYLNSVIGGWPPRISNASEAKQVRQRWDQARTRAEKLFKDNPSSIEIKFLLGDLLRMGHNIDVPGAAQASDSLLKEVIKAAPQDYRAYYALASMYVGANPKLAPIAEEYFLKAENLATRQIIPAIYQGLGFACIYQNRVQEGIGYFEKFLELSADQQVKEDVQKIVDHLKSNKDLKIVFQE